MLKSFASWHAELILPILISIAYLFDFLIFRIFCIDKCILFMISLWNYSKKYDRVKASDEDIEARARSGS